MSEWPSTKARRALAALQRIGWQIKRSSGSHRTLCRLDGLISFFPFTMMKSLAHAMLSRIARRTGLKPKYL